MGITADIIKDIGPQPQSFDIERETKENTNYRSVAWSGRYLQVTLMSIPVGGDVGLEAHPETDPFLRLDAGSGRVQMGPAHNITNIGTKPMQVYAICSPAHHKPGKDGCGGRSRQRRRVGGVVGAAETRARKHG